MKARISAFIAIVVLYLLLQMPGPFAQQRYPSDQERLDREARQEERMRRLEDQQIRQLAAWESHTQDIGSPQRQVARIDALEKGQSQILNLMIGGAVTFVSVLIAVITFFLKPWFTRRNGHHHGHHDEGNVRQMKSS